MRFTNLKDKLTMCFNYSLKRSNGLPDDDENLTDYNFKSLCADDGGIWSSGWTEDSFSGKIREDLVKELDELQIKMCKTYYYSLNYEEKYIYCSL
jgi:hypothetical protein